MQLTNRTQNVGTAGLYIRELTNEMLTKSTATKEQVSINIAKMGSCMHALGYTVPEHITIDWIWKIISVVILAKCLLAVLAVGKDSSEVQYASITKVPAAKQTNQNKI